MVSDIMVAFLHKLNKSKAQFGCVSMYSLSKDTTSDLVCVHGA